MPGPAGDVILNKIDVLLDLTELTAMNLSFFVLKRKVILFTANHYPPPSTAFKIKLKS